jgi:hypothetical protein
MSINVLICSLALYSLTPKHILTTHIKIISYTVFKNNDKHVENI